MGRGKRHLGAERQMVGQERAPAVRQPHPVREQQGSPGHHTILRAAGDQQVVDAPRRAAVRQELGVEGRPVRLGERVRPRAFLQHRRVERTVARDVEVTTGDDEFGIGPTCVPECSVEHPQL